MTNSVLNDKKKICKISSHKVRLYDHIAGLPNSNTDRRLMTIKIIDYTEIFLHVDVTTSYIFVIYLIRLNLGVKNIKPWST